MKILMISARNFGDSVILVELIQNLKDDFEIDVFTRSEFISIFSELNNISKIYTANFPMGTMKNFNFYEALNLLSVCNKLKEKKYDFVVNNIGDFRENFIGWFINAKENVSVKWNKEHPFRNLIWKGFDFLVDRYVEIPVNLLNIYDIQKFIASSITKSQNTFENKLAKKEKRDKIKIAIHPMASQKTRFWEYSNWIEIIKEFGREENKIIIFCAPNELEELKIVFHEVKIYIEIIAKSIDLFLDTLKSVNIFIGLDSFSIHAAYMMNVPNLIMLNGANDARVWAPPGANVLSGGQNCEFFPCYNKPKCLEKEFEYICMKTIMPDEVIEAIKKKYA